MIRRDRQVGTLRAGAHFSLEKALSQMRHGLKEIGGGEALLKTWSQWK